ncbi:MAG: murein biosynthesis integral membrane protein MurJ [Planctomycetota bacterium]
MNTNTPQTPNTQPDEPTTRFVGHAVLVGLLTLVSRFTGLARDAVLAAALGLSSVADAFFIGFLVPNLFRRLFGEGALAAAFIPQYTELLERDPQLARRFASATIAGLTVLLLAITLVVELGLWWLAARIGGGEAGGKTALALMYTRIMLPYMPLVCLVAMVGGVLQVHKRFGPPAAAPVLLNLVMIAAVLIPTAMLRDTANPQRAATWLAFGVLLGGVGQLIWQAVVLVRVSGLAGSFAGVGPSMKKMLVMMGPMVLGLAVFQINALLDSLIAFFLAPGEVLGESIEWFGQSVAMPLQRGDVAALQWSQRLYQFPLGVFGIAIATAIFPALSAAAAKWAKARDDSDSADPAQIQAEQDAFARTLRQGLRLTLFIGLPASVGLMLTRVPLARVVYERGAFESEDSLRVATILAGYAAAVWAYSMTHTITRAFYALQDAKTPLKVGVGMVGLNLTLNLTLIWPLGAAGLAWATAISAAGQVGLLLLLIRRRVSRPIDAEVLRSWAKTVLATLLMGAALWPVTLLIDLPSLSLAGAGGVLAGMVILGMTLVLVVAWLGGAEELSWLRRRAGKGS